MKRLFLAFVGLIALAGSAAAADLSRPAPQPYYPPAAVYAPYSWTGFYVGINGGGGFGSSNWNLNGSRDVSGGLIGGTAGYNYQYQQAVFGVEGDIDWSDINGSSSNAACPVGCKTGNSWLGTVRGRIGYAADRFMPFITGGVAFGDINASAPGVAGASQNNAGWTLGAGLEAAFAPHWTGKVEYLYVDLGSISCGLSCGGGLASDNVSFHTNLLRAGVNYKF
jgi:outer membrane immunogenic protein